MNIEIKNVIQSREQCVYTKCYCEENVWKLCEYANTSAPQLLGCCFAVFLSNDRRAVPIWKQKACEKPGQYVLWDYHVILLYKDATSCLVYDLDTELDFPCDVATYLKQAIGSEERLATPFHRMFRIIRGEEYLKHFASDRSHMVREDGSWLAEPPSYPRICTQECSNNIDDFISMDPQVGLGDVMALPELLKYVSPNLQHLPTLL